MATFSGEGAFGSNIRRFRKPKNKFRIIDTNATEKHERARSQCPIPCPHSPSSKWPSARIHLERILGELSALAYYLKLPAMALFWSGLSIKSLDYEDRHHFGYAWSSAA
jgi:hypothetical protein